MRHYWKPGVLVLLAAALSPQLPAQHQVPAKQHKHATELSIEPGAMEALNRMGAYLRTLTAFEVNSAVSHDIVLTDGLKMQQNWKVNLLARLPDRLRAQIDRENGTKFYFFDGKSFTLFARNQGFYATVAAPPTLGELADDLDKYGIEIPLVDLFMWGRPGNVPPKITAAFDLGPATVEGVTCQQYAFRQEGLDWQVWIQLGQHPLPRKLVLTTTTDEARPQHTSVMSWNLAPSYNEASFVFEPPQGSRKIVFATDN